MGETGGRDERGLDGDRRREHGRGIARDAARAHLDAQPRQRSRNPLADCRLVHPELQCHFLAGEILEVMQHEHLAVGSGEATDRILQRHPPPRGHEGRSLSRDRVFHLIRERHLPRPQPRLRLRGADRLINGRMMQPACERGAADEQGGLAREHGEDPLRHVLRRLHAARAPECGAEHHALIPLHESRERLFRALGAVAEEQVGIAGGAHVHR